MITGSRSNSNHRMPRTYSARRNRAQRNSAATRSSPSRRPRRMTRRTLSPVSSHRPYIEIVDNTDDIEEDGFVLLGVSKFSPKRSVGEANATGLTPSAESQLTTLRQKEEDRNRCEICLEFMWTPVVTGCGHIFCGECLLKVATIDRAAFREIKCPKCRSQIRSTPIVLFDIRRRVEEMARDRGFHIPTPPPFDWPAGFNTWMAANDDDDWLIGQATGFY